MNDVLEFIRNNIDVVISLRETQDGVSISRKLQHYFSMRPFVGKKRVFYEKILSYASLAEKNVPGSGIVFLKKILDIDVNKSLHLQTNDKQSLIAKLANTNLDKDVINMLIEALAIASTQTTFMIKKSSNTRSSIEYSEGYKFKIKSLIDFKKTFEIKNSYVICIDGYIENISEIHHLLEFLSDDLDNCLLFCRGMSEDVKHTIKVNLDRGTINLFPYLVPFDVEFCNTLVDIAVVAGGDVISTTKGQLISAININNLVKIDNCECSKESLVLSNKLTKSSVARHVDNLKTSMEERRELETIFSDRIASLTSSYLEFRLPFDINYNVKCQQLDEGIRLISSIMNKNLNGHQLLDDLLSSYKKLLTDVVISGDLDGKNI